jgi:hypothetical protein
MNIQFDLNDIEQLYHTGSTSLIKPYRFEYLRGDGGDLPYQMWIGDDALQAMVIYKILIAHNYKAGMYWDTAGTPSGQFWGYTIKTNYHFRDGLDG